MPGPGRAMSERALRRLKGRWLEGSGRVDGGGGRSYEGAGRFPGVRGGVKRECGAPRRRQLHGCTRNCRRWSFAKRHWGRAPREGGDDEDREPGDLPSRLENPTARRATWARRTRVTTPRWQTAAGSPFEGASPVPAVDEVTVLGLLSCRLPGDSSTSRARAACSSPTRRAPPGAAGWRCARSPASATAPAASARPLPHRLLGLRLRRARDRERRRPGGGRRALRRLERRLPALARPARGAEARADRPHPPPRHPEGPGMTLDDAPPRALHRRHRLSRRRQDHADPPSAGATPAGGGWRSSSTSSATSASTAPSSRAAGWRPARRRTWSSSPTAASAAPWPTTSCRRSTASWRSSRGSSTS